MSIFNVRLLVGVAVAAHVTCFAVVAAETNKAIAADTPALSAGVFTAAQAAERVGESLTVTGRVASSIFLENSDRKPTFLNLDKAYPNQPLTVVIFGKDRGLFETPPDQLFKGRIISVTGEVKSYRDRAEIVVTDPKAISLLHPEGAAAEEAATSKDGEPAAERRE